MSNPYETQLETLIAEYERRRSTAKYDDSSDIPVIEIRDLQTRCFAVIQRATGKDSIYFQRATEIGASVDHVHNVVAGQMGVAKSLLSDIKNGFLKSLEEIIHGDVFGDYLEMADHLTQSGFKDAGAVIAGSTLKAHLRQLCAKFDVQTIHSGKPQKADTMNAELARAGAYTKLDQKNVTAWLDLRNNAAHGHYSEYDVQQVKLFVDNIRNFVTRHPA